MRPPQIGGLGEQIVAVGLAETSERDVENVLSLDVREGEWRSQQRGCGMRAVNGPAGNGADVNPPVNSFDESLNDLEASQPPMFLVRIVVHLASIAHP